MSGPLDGVRVVEFAGIGPAPLAGMLLADLGADVVVVERPDTGPVRGMIPPALQVVDRGKRRTTLDLKSAEGQAQALELVGRADVVVEGLRPGAMERLGLGPDVLLAHRPKLVYARITGWGQTGPRAQTAGHDITYIALTGALHAIGRAGEAPVPPVNLLGDYAGGTMFALTGVLAALFEAERSGRGQVVDVAMIDGVMALLAPMLSIEAAGLWRDQRGVNLFDTGAPFYDVYPTSDGRYVAVGALEDQFFAALVEGLGLDRRWLADRQDRSQWPALRQAIGEAIATRTRDGWDARFRDTDGCLAPVLSLAEVERESHHAARQGAPCVDGRRQPAPAPRFTRTPCREPSAPPTTLVDPGEVIRSWNSPVRPEPTDADA